MRPSLDENSLTLLQTVFWTSFVEIRANNMIQPNGRKDGIKMRLQFMTVFYDRNGRQRWF